MKETDLYPHVKALLVAQGYDVKAEIGAADVVALRPGEDEPVIVELKTGFALTLFHQAVARQAMTDFVYVAVPRLPGKRFLRALKDNKTLCRRLGLGLITVRLSDGHTEVHLDPAPYAPRKVKARKSRLLREFARREGDPNLGGAARSGPLVTAYRQDAVKIALHLRRHGASKCAEIRAVTGVTTATRIMADDHYGWFERVTRGVYQLTPRGTEAMGNGEDTEL
ncbi:DUF2161 domain-containing phosphodiesterase [Marinovum algicola]|uniref:DUF2161 domain-containing phosphodiesterase n=1 Tax=Marinovum algicola TaxID=42444 RepID=UPI0024BA91E4|nr:DUF2161 family putative PD-(D/E)XK-type phosphodiesterase [Marinovum algicola]